jgi:hypothetical protein
MTELRDAEARRRILTDFDTTLFIEAAKADGGWKEKPKREHKVIPFAVLIRKIEEREAKRKHK